MKNSFHPMRAKVPETRRDQGANRGVMLIFIVGGQSQSMDQFLHPVCERGP